MSASDETNDPAETSRLRARVAELEQALVAAQQDVEWWRGIVESAPHHIAIFNEELRFLYLNRRASDYVEDNFQQFHIRDFVEPDFGDAAEMAFRHTLDTGVLTEFESQERVYKHWYFTSVGRLELKDGRRFVISASQNIDTAKAVEAELRNSQSLWKSLVANSPDIILLMDREAKIHDINHTAPGYTRENVIGSLGYELVLEPYRQGLLKAIQRAVDLATPQHFELQDTAEQSWWWVTLVPIHNHHRADLVLAICNDTTERRRTEESLRESESRLRLVLAQTPAIVWTTDRDLRITSGSGAGLTALNMPETAWIGRTLSEVLGSTEPTFPPHIAHRAALHGRSVTFEHSWHDIAFHIHVEPLRDAGGEIVGTIGLALDINARKLAEQEVRSARDDLEARVAQRTAELDRLNQSLRDDIAKRERIEAELRDSQERFRIIAETVPVSVVITRQSDGLLMFANHRAGEMVGVSHEALLGRRSSEFYADPADREAILARLKTGAKMIEAELRLVRSDNTPVMVNVSYQPIVFDNVPAILTGFVDITKRMETEQLLRGERRLLKRLLELHERDRQLISYEIHDGIVQDMTAALMFFESSRPLEGGADDTSTETFDHGVRLLRGSINEARRLINGLRPPVLEDEGVIPAIEALIEEIKDNAGMEIEFHSDVTFQRLAPALEMAIYRIVQEGLNNVWHHSRSPRALVKLSQHDDTIDVTIQDWGIGFDPAKVSKRRYGLMGVRERARLLNGRAVIDAKPGQGTLLHVELPLFDALLPTVE